MRGSLSSRASTRSSTAYPSTASLGCWMPWLALGSCLFPTLSTFHDLAERFTDAFAPALVDQAKRQLEEAYATLVAARSAGVILAMGHDSGPPGDNAIELVRMVDGGLSALEGISAATQGSASALGLPDVGTVTPGAIADLLVIDGDPLADVGVLRGPERIWMVIQGGNVVASRGRPAVAVTLETSPA